MTTNKTDRFFGECADTWLAACDRAWLGTPPTHLHPADRSALRKIIERCGDRAQAVIEFACQNWRRALRKRIADAMSVDRAEVPGDARLGLIADNVDLVLVALDETRHYLSRPVEPAPALQPRPRALQVVDPVRLAADAWNQHLGRSMIAGGWSQRVADRASLTQSDVNDLAAIVARVGLHACTLIYDLNLTYVPALQWHARRIGEPYEHSYQTIRPGDLLANLDILLDYRRAIDEAEDAREAEAESRAVPLIDELRTPSTTAVRVG